MGLQVTSIYDYKNPSTQSWKKNPNPVSQWWMEPSDSKWQTQVM